MYWFCPEKDLLDVVQLPLLERERIDLAERQQRHPVRSDSDGGVEAGEMTGINLLQIGAEHPPIQKRNFQFKAVCLEWVQQPLIVIRGVEVAGIGIIGGFVAQHKAGIAGFLPRIRVGAGAAVQCAAVVNRQLVKGEGSREADKLTVSADLFGEKGDRLAVRSNRMYGEGTVERKEIGLKIRPTGAEISLYPVRKNQFESDHVCTSPFRL